MSGDGAYARIVSSRDNYMFDGAVLDYIVDFLYLVTWTKCKRCDKSIGVTTGDDECYRRLSIWVFVFTLAKPYSR